MPEERISYLEPIDDGAVTEAFRPEHGANGSDIERPASVETHTERKSESESEAVYRKILASAQSGISDDALTDVDDDAKKVSLKMDADSKVSHLVDLAQTKGVVYAVKVARHLNDFYVLDQLHDDLANRLHQSLKEKGLITE